VNAHQTPAAKTRTPRVAAHHPNIEDLTLRITDTPAANSTNPMSIKSSQSRCGPNTAAKIPNAGNMRTARMSAGKPPDLRLSMLAPSITLTKIRPIMPLSVAVVESTEGTNSRTNRAMESVSVSAPKRAREGWRAPQSYSHRFSADGSTRPYSDVLPRISK
jgi:hypothetical protein